ncbi:MAG: aldehyde ferredoxin oxidoreductase family protein [Deltaproteobacteria bacterium]|nr:aldehyde ferredoxin oxidoreductase family protein [Deltaproteobacteria bacterium]MBW2651927.1 aldehyde ferredoxin oxidoreductase family protein [Deltaproteobacteria bacterium]
MNGWVGKILRVNLTQGSTRVEELPAELNHLFLGGRGLASKLLFDEVNPQVEPLSPENKLIFMTGPLTGTGAIGGASYVVVTKSPLTGSIACSTTEGYFGPELKFAGYDGIILEGKSPEPVYLSIEDDTVELLSASHLWGKSTHKTEEIIRAEKENPWIARETFITSIGPAGENLVKIASIINDKHRAAARSGVGAVMGSKNLKAIAVRGTKAVSLANGKMFLDSVERAWEKFKTTPVIPQALNNIGTSFLVDLINESGVLPARNFQTGVMKNIEKISGEHMAETILKINKGCFSCPIACIQVTEVEDPAFLGKGEGPEYRSIALIGASCGIDNINAIAKINYLCDEMGIDALSYGSAIACAMELTEKKIISKKETGVNLKFGNAEAVVELVEKVVKREGFGEILAEGGYQLAAKYNHPEYFMGVKKQGSPAFDPRGIQGLGLEYATSNSGVSHALGYLVTHKILGIRGEIDPLTTEGKAPLVKLFQDGSAVFDSAGLCRLLLLGIWIDEVIPMLEAATGISYTEEDLQNIGERIWNLERLFNVKAGFSSTDDTIPQRMLKEPMPEGPAKGQVCKLDEMLPEYYNIRGWTHKGIPTEDKLKSLGLV